MSGNGANGTSGREPGRTYDQATYAVSDDEKTPTEAAARPETPPQEKTPPAPTVSPAAPPNRKRGRQWAGLDESDDDEDDDDD